MAATVDEDQIFISNCELQYHTRVPTTSGYKSEVPMTPSVDSIVC